MLLLNLIITLETCKIEFYEILTKIFFLAILLWKEIAWNSLNAKSYYLLKCSGKIQSSSCHSKGHRNRRPTFSIQWKTVCGISASVSNLRQFIFNLFSFGVFCLEQNVNVIDEYNELVFLEWFIGRLFKYTWSIIEFPLGAFTENSFRIFSNDS